MKKEKAKLIIDVTKNIIEQYMDQLGYSINEKQIDPKVINDSYEFECTVTRAIRALDNTQKLLNNFEDIFNNDEKLQEEKNKILWIEGFSEEEKEISLAIEFSKKAFKEIGIPEYSIQPLVCHFILTNAKNTPYFIKVWGGEFGKEIYNEKGIYNVGQLKINNTLSPSMNSDSQYYYSQGRDLLLDANQTYEIVDKYFDDLSYTKLLTINDYVEAIKTIAKLANGNDPRFLYSTICYDFLKRRLYHKSSMLYENTELLDKYNNKSLDSKEDTINNKVTILREKIDRLQSLNKEEEELKERLSNITKEQEQIKEEINGFKL